MSLCFNRWIFVWLVYCIDVVASFPGSCNINNWKAGGGGWERGYLCDNLGVKFERTKQPEERPEQLLFQGENWASNLLSTCKILTWLQLAKRYRRGQSTPCFWTTIYRSCTRSAVVLRLLLMKSMFLVTRPRVILMAASIGHYWLPREAVLPVCVSSFLAFYCW